MAKRLTGGVYVAKDMPCIAGSRLDCTAYELLSSYRLRYPFLEVKKVRRSIF